MKKITKKAIVIAIIAGLLVFFDGIIVNIFNLEGSFTWVAFVSWTVFFGSTVKERFKAIFGYVIGFLAATAIICLGNFLGFIPSIFGIAIASILATMIMNFTVIEIECFEKYFPYSASGIFVGMAMTFSGLGVGLTTNTLQGSMLMLVIIVLYGVLGLVSGWATLKFGTEN